MMNAKGLTKLVEECGELAQVAAKKIAYIDTDAHPDGGPPLSTRLEHEIADVLAACEFVAEKFDLDEEAIRKRMIEKFETYHTWDKGDL